MDTANWITIFVAGVSAAVGYGANQAKIAAQASDIASLRGSLKEAEAARERELSELRASSERQGKRLGRLEAWRKAVQAVDNERIRKTTGAVPLSPLSAADSQEEDT